MNGARCAAAATLLPNGEVLVAPTAELYSPVTGTWQETGNLNTSRIGPLAELLGNGTVLVAGGTNVTGSVSGDCALSAGCKFNQLTSAEIFNPSQGNWAPTGSMPASAGLGSLLANSDVLKFFNSVYTPAPGSWTPAGEYPTGVAGGSTAILLGTGFVLATGFISTYITGRMTTNRAQNTATHLLNGQVLVSGGHNHNSDALTSAELYTP